MLQNQKQFRGTNNLKHLPKQQFLNVQYSVQIPNCLTHNGLHKI